MNEDQREAWRKAAAALAAQRRRQRWRPHRSLQAVQSAGMMRVPPPESERPAEAGRHTHKEYRIMPRHPSVPDDLTGWVHLGVVSTDTAMFAIVAPEMSGVLCDKWMARYLDEDGAPLKAPQDADAGSFEELEVGDDRAVLVATGSDGGYAVEGRFGDIYGDGHMSLTEVRIRIWVCPCTCHDEDPENTCDGDCHDASPQPIEGNRSCR